MLNNITNWKELKKQLRKIEGKAVFKLKRINSMNDGTFYRVLHKVKSHELVFFDGKNLVYLPIGIEEENNIKHIENGFIVGNCTYILDIIMEG